MIALTYALLGIGLLAYMLGAAAALAHLGASPRAGLLNRALYIAAAGAVALVLTPIMRFFTWGVVPLTTGADSMTLFLAMSGATAVAITAQERFRPLLSFYLPPLALVGLLCGWFAVRDLSVAPPDKGISQLLVIIHVGLAFLAYALFLIASLTSIVYVLQAKALKQRRTTGLFHRLPSLENLDHILFALIKLGYPAFATTLLLGLIWAWNTPHILSPTWWLSPKIAHSILMVLFYALCYHARALGWLRGPKLAYLVFLGFGILLAAYFGLEAFRVTNTNFWGEV